MAQYSSRERDEGYYPAREDPNLKGESRARTPTTEHAARLGIKYGDRKTASIGGRGSEAMAALVNSVTDYSKKKRKPTSKR